MKCLHKKAPPLAPNEYEVSPLSCPHCGFIVTISKNMAGPSRGPQPGDFGVCVNCCEPNRMGANLALLKLTDEDMLDLEAQPDIKRTLYASIDDLKIKKALRD